MKYVLIGTGRLAQVLATLLSGSDWRCMGVWGRNEAQAAALAAQLSAPVLIHLKDLPESAATLLAVADDAIVPVAAALPEQTSTVIHFSGTVSSDALLPHPHRAVCWPVYSIGGNNFPEIAIPAVGEWSDFTAQAALQSLTKTLGWTLHEVRESSRRHLHLAAVVGNNFINHLLCICEQLCAESNVPAAILQPLLHQTFNRAFSGNPCSGQTGPARRGDVATQQTHLALLETHPHWQQVYETLSKSIAALYPSP